MKKREDFLKASEKDIIAENLKTKHYYNATFEDLNYRRKYRIEYSLNILLHPFAVILITIAPFLILGFYYDWNWKIVIEKSFQFGLASLFVYLAKYRIDGFLKQHKNDKTQK